MLMPADLVYVNFIQIGQADTAETSGMQITIVNRDVRAQLDVEVSFVGRKDGISTTYRQNEQYGSKVTVTTHRKVLINVFTVIQDGRI